jgi:hypothetical protein
LSVRVHEWLLFQAIEESSRPLQGHIVVIDTKEEAVAGCLIVRARQGGMIVRTPLVKAKHGSIGVHDLTPVVMAGSRLAQAEERLVPFKAARNVAYADDRPYAFHIFI